MSAQHDHWGDGKGKPSGCEIYGTVVDSISGQPIEYASISVIDSDNNIATGGITDSDGKFKIEEIKPGIYNLKIEFMGYSIVTVQDVSLSFREERTKDFGTIKLQASIQGEQVRISGKKRDDLQNAISELKEAKFDFLSNND